MVLLIGPAAGVPVSPLWVLVGARFGPWWGTFLGLLGLATTISLSHGLARGLFRPLLERFILKRWPALANFRADTQTGILLLCRFSPIPLAVQNYGVPLIGIPLKRNLKLSVPILSLHLLAFIWLGEAVTSRGIGPWLIAGGLLAAAIIVGRSLRRRFAIPKAGQTASESLAGGDGEANPDSKDG